MIKQRRYKTEAVLLARVQFITGCLLLLSR
jgi:hypothetical protein